jgi:hypothetical protein
LGRKAWEHARRRAEDGCIVLAYVSNPPYIHHHPLTGAVRSMIRALRSSLPSFPACLCRFRATSTPRSKLLKPSHTASLH